MLKFKFYIFLIFICFSTVVKGQKTPTYIVEKDSIVFNFDVRDYKKFTKDNSSRRVDADELDIQKVTLSGQFNNWSRDGWEMQKTGDYIYQLKKKLTHFDSEFSWEFKYLINNQYWAEPDKSFDHITESEKSSIWRKVYNLKMFTVHSDENGNAHFFLKGYEDAEKAILSGTFNRWDEHNLEMEKTKGGWKISLNLKPDTYQYKFIVDGNWMEDPNNAHKEYNEHHTFNSILTIKETVTFELKGYENASSVVLTGSFNDWDSKDFPMKKIDDKWKYTLTLAGGKHHYKFIVDGKWIIDPANPIKEHDEYGNINSVKMVE
ncbi:hypothetical protein UMM65_08775 [Aureibaculum sp. 2210JD6-5]|uniref:hypothetical protein n=1 Tax=Aureibaculum sp. 2210JD6-5 TaxID=3103957 RepID=UPI002AAE3558|nr:hypothetical protein [Aureibaculum sp. 2210JD6-5]MDY7395333.1 hypothetical protein [Aureibaculum sp. 2210JD6-5]